MEKKVVNDPLPRPLYYNYASLVRKHFRDKHDDWKRKMKETGIKCTVMESLDPVTFAMVSILWQESRDAYDKELEEWKLRNPDTVKAEEQRREQRRRGDMSSRDRHVRFTGEYLANASSSSQFIIDGDNYIPVAEVVPDTEYDYVPMAEEVPTPDIP